jgi:hypothetical protein
VLSKSLFIDGCVSIKREEKDTRCYFSGLYPNTYVSHGEPEYFICYHSRCSIRQTITSQVKARVA